MSVQIDYCYTNNAGSANEVFNLESRHQLLNIMGIDDKNEVGFKTRVKYTK